MALNCSSRSLLLSDDCAGKMLGFGCWSEEASPLSSSGVNSLWWDDLDLEFEEESDPTALLPSDPFGMVAEEATSATITAAIANCMEDYTTRSGGGRPFRSGSSDDFIVDLLNYTLIFAPDPWIDGHMGVFDGFFWSGGLFWSGGPSGGGGASQSSWLPPDAPCSQPSGFVESPSRSQDSALACCGRVVGAAPSGFAENPSSSRDTASVCCGSVGAAHWQEGSDAHPGLYIALGYLGLRDILAVEMTCKSLHAAVRSELYSWNCIHINSRLGDKISDADLLCLSQKFPGVLQCLSLVQCKNLTNQGLKAILQSNPQLTKLGIFGNVRLTYQGFIEILRSFNTEATIGFKKLRVSNLTILNREQYEELVSLLKLDKGLALHKQEPRIYHADCFLPDHHDAPECCFFPDLHDEYALDIERCPLCDEYKLVYDCPAEGCNNSRLGTCRGCILCIQRCLQCGRCIENEYEETFSLNSLCPSCQKDRDSIVAEK